jgi:protein AbiQ
MDKLRLYNVSDDYIRYLRNFDKKVFSNKEESRKKERKYLGIVLRVNDFKYYIYF